MVGVVPGVQALHNRARICRTARLTIFNVRRILGGHQPELWADHQTFQYAEHDPREILAVLPLLLVNSKNLM
jgi:hypothetical protein